MRAIIILMAIALVLTACNDANGNGDADSDATGQNRDPAVGSDDQTSETTDDIGNPENVEAYSVADAGGVEFAFDGEQLTLVQAYPNSGWSHSVEVDDDDQIEVDFHENGRDVEFEAEIEDGRLVIEVLDNYDSVDEHSFTIGAAGVLELETTEDQLTIDEVTPNEGWTHTVDEGDEAIVIEFRHDSGTLGIRFEAELDNGNVEVAIVTREYR